MARKRPAATAAAGALAKRERLHSADAQDLWQFRMQCFDLKNIGWADCPHWVEKKLVQKFLFGEMNGKAIFFQPFNDEMRVYIVAKLPCAGIGRVGWVVKERKTVGHYAEVTFFNSPRNMWLVLRRIVRQLG